MAWTEQTASSVNYDLQDDVVEWNNGTALWNVVGNVETVTWNYSAPTYATESSAPVTWTES